MTNGAKARSTCNSIQQIHEIDILKKQNISGKLKFVGLVIMLRPRDIKVVYLPEPQQFVGLWPFDWAVKRGLAIILPALGSLM